jgi:hypothetical protein
MIQTIIQNIFVIMIRKKYSINNIITVIYNHKINKDKYSINVILKKKIVSISNNRSNYN